MTFTPHCSKWAGAKTILCKVRMEPKMYTFSTLIQYGPWSLSRCSKTREENGYSWEKKKIILICICRWYNSAHYRFWRCYRKTLRPGRCFQQSCKAQTNINKINSFFFYPTNMHAEKEIRNAAQSMRASKKWVKKSGINLTKEKKDGYTEKFRTLKKELEEDTSITWGVD